MNPGLDEQRVTLRRAYAARVAARDKLTKQDWKLDFREHCLAALQAAGAKNLIELGAGTGQDSLFFAAQGVDVLATDLTPEHVAACRQKGLRAKVMDICNLQLGEERFDAAYAMNCLLHLPKAEFPVALENVRDALNPDGLFFLGQYGGRDSEGVYEQDSHEPKRFFSFFSDEALKQALAPYFSVQNFQRIELGEEDDLHFQALTLQKAA